MRLSYFSWRDHVDGDPAIDIDAHVTGTRTVPARRTLYREGEPVAEFATLLEGWAFRYRLLPDGRRQILSIALPGEAIALHTLWVDRMSFSVQSLTDLELRLFDHRALVERLRADGALAFRLGEMMAHEVMVFENRLTNLGRRTAVERVARFILILHTLLAQRGLVEGETFPFPLRQQHIADALGMTPVHVSRVFSELRAMKLISRVGEAIEILDHRRLTDVAGP
ncbi:MAG: Crp/Fnr family transcriptional regulator [Candidatus Eiseniibacteriota bacterium]